MYNPPNFSLLAIDLPILGTLHFQIDFRISLPISINGPVGILIGLALGIYNQFEGNCYLINTKSSNP